MIIMDSVMIPRPPALPPMPIISSLHPVLPTSQKVPSVCSHESNLSQGFRLMEDQGDSGSVYSIYKQKIDAMFESDSSSHTKNSVQQRIEKMFSDVAEDSGIKSIEKNLHSFSVDYLGSVSLSDKVSSLAGLQNPLKELYFAYKKTTKPKKVLTGRLEISNHGLKVQYQGEKGDLEQMNSFPTIAVWSAVKFVIQKNQNWYAFLPLITDPDNIDKKALFRQLNEAEKKYITAEAHSPLFAVVMRKMGVQKQLECHGFVCQTSEDAIVIAATLYKSLMAHMKAKEKKPKSKNGITCMSIASSICNEKSDDLIPVRPPRKKRSSTSSTLSENDHLEVSDTQPLLQKSFKKSVKTRKAPTLPDDLDAIVSYEENGRQEVAPKSFTEKINTYMSREQKQITAEIKQMVNDTNRGLRHVQNFRKVDESGSLGKKDKTGDILTKVTIPRSGSFLNAGGLTRYKSKVSRSNGQVAGGSPLGFNELFNEFRLQEGLHSMDEILGVIIDPEGMSFNDLKPIYKEFLLKLSVTLTKDELYQRSKMIMRRQKKKQLKRSLPQKTTPHIRVGSKFKRLKHVFRKSFKMKSNKKVTVPDKKLDEKVAESTISTSSYDTRQFLPKDQPKKGYQRNKSDRMSTSEESDFFSLRRKTKNPKMIINTNHNRNSSSGYVSCSECSYDSDTCTCISADKCYCSLGQKKVKKLRCDCHFENPITFCDCDTDSCAESNKCYCQNPNTNSLILKQMEKRGLITQHQKVCKKMSTSKSTRSLEYIPLGSYYEKLGPRRKKSSVEYEPLQKMTSGTYASVLNDRLQKQSSLRSYSSGKLTTKSGHTLQSSAISGASEEALSVKKSAEIAALFADIKLSQTTDIAHKPQNHFDLSRNAYNKSKSQHIPKTKAFYPQKMVQNALYSRTKGNMYSARNGLYTIPSQSDESRRSSVSDDRRDYYKKRDSSKNLETSLGYLP